MSKKQNEPKPKKMKKLKPENRKNRTENRKWFDFGFSFHLDRKNRTEPKTKIGSISVLFPSRPEKQAENRNRFDFDFGFHLDRKNEPKSENGSISVLVSISAWKNRTEHTRFPQRPNQTDRTALNYIIFII